MKVLRAYFELFELKMGRFWGQMDSRIQRSNIAIDVDIAAKRIKITQRKVY